MAGVIIAGVIAGSGIYYLSRVVPRVAKRAMAAQKKPRIRLSFHRNVDIVKAQTQVEEIYTLYPEPYHQYEYGFTRNMSNKEAYQLLGFEKAYGISGMANPPSREEIKTKYQELIKSMHSDVGGSPYMARKIIEAREILLR